MADERKFSSPTGDLFISTRRRAVRYKPAEHEGSRPLPGTYLFQREKNYEKGVDCVLVPYRGLIYFNPVP